MKLMPHNQKAVKEIVSAYVRGARRIVYVSGVGTGKSFVFLGLTEYIKGRILYVVPKYAVQENIAAYGEFASVRDKVDFVTFNQFTDGPSAEKLLDGHELIVIDECTTSGPIFTVRYCPVQCAATHLTACISDSLQRLSDIR